MSHLIEVKQPASRRSSKLITLERPSIPSRCRLSNRSFQHASPQIWNSLPSTFRIPSYSTHQPSLSYEQFHKQLKTYLFDLSFPSGVHEIASLAETSLPLVSHPWTVYLDFGSAPFMDPFWFLHIGLDLAT